MAPHAPPTPCLGAAWLPHSLLTNSSSVTTELRPGGQLTQELPGGECAPWGGHRAGLTQGPSCSLCQTTTPHMSLESARSSATCCRLW